MSRRQPRRRARIQARRRRHSSACRWPIVSRVRRFPYFEEYLKERRSVLLIYRFERPVDRNSKLKYALSDSPPICVRNFEDCPLYQAEKRREDQTITRY